MEIVYRTKLGVYPFNRPKDTESTYVEHLVSNSTLPLTQQLREIIRLYKNIQCPYIIRLNKFLKDENEIHFFFNYYPSSLQLYLSKKPQTVLQRLRQQLTCALQCLQRSALKAQASIQNIAVDNQGSLKLFIMPQNLSKGDNLNEFYVTQRTKLFMQLQQVWSQDNKKDQEDHKPQHPGFRISGNELIFTRTQNQNSAQSSHNQQEKTVKPKKESIHSPHSAKMILAQIEKQKQKAKKLKEKHNHLKSEGIDHKTQAQQAQRYSKVVKKNSINSEIQSLRDSHKSQQLNFINKSVQDKLTNSSAEPSSHKRYVNYEERPTSTLKYQKQAESHQNQLSYEDIRAIALKHLQAEGKQLKEQPKIQVTTEMVSKYKMKIVTCQQIEFEGKEGDDIEKIAQQKLIEYQQQYSMPKISIQNVSQNSDQANNQPSNEKSGSFQENHDRKEKPKTEGGQNEQIMTKILKAKEKAENVLKEYAKTKKK